MPEPANERPDGLIDRARRGDYGALAELLTRNRDRLQREAAFRLGDDLRRKVRSSDVLQSTYIDVLGSIARFRGQTEEEFARWVVRILENNIRDAAKYFRADKRNRSRESSGHDMHSLDVVDPGPTPSSEAALGDELALISRAMQRLPEDYFRILSLHMRPGQDHRATARAMNRSEGASRVLLARARAALLLEIEGLRGGAA